MKYKVNLAGIGGAQTDKGGWWHENSNFRKLVPQLLVTTINNLLVMDLSMMLAFPTLVIGALYSPEGGAAGEDGLRLSADEASWLGSLVYIFQPLGSSVSGLLTEPLGRKRGMMFVNVTPLVGWLMLRFARSVAELYAANAVLGLSIGFMEAPVLTYCGEISEPRLRSFLTAYTGVLAQLGYLLVYGLGVALPWRTAASLCAAVPVITFLCMIVVPDSPLWLLSRGRRAEAERALCWLRGWVRPEAVQEELRQQENYADITRRLMQEVEAEGGRCCGRSCPLMSRLRELGRAQTLRPLLFTVAFFFVFHSSGMSGVRPYMVHIIQQFALPLNELWATVLTALLGLAAILTLTLAVARAGKRLLSLVSIAGCAVSCIVLGAYAFAVVRSGPAGDLPNTWLPFAAFIALSFFTYLGVGQIPWMYVAEVFPLRSRGLASGVTAAFAYVLYFTAAKTYLQLESALALHGVFWLYGAFGVAGFAFLYWALPETEGRTLEEVEAYFSPDKSVRAAAWRAERSRGPAKGPAAAPAPAPAPAPPPPSLAQTTYM